MKIFNSNESFEIKERGWISRIVKPEDMGGLTFGELDALIKNQEPVQINGRVEIILGYEYFAIGRKDSDPITFPAGFCVKGGKTTA